MRMYARIIMMLLLFLTLYNYMALAEISGQCGNSLYWNIDDNGTICFTGSGDWYYNYQGYHSSVSTPPWIRGDNQSSMKQAYFPEGLTYIADRCFYCCYNLKVVNIPNTVTEIGWGSFNSSGISSISLPENLKIIGSSAFEGCALTEVDIPDGTTSIGSRAFRFSSLKRIIIPDSVTFIDSGQYSSNDKAIDEDVTIYCNRYSEAEEYAKNNGNPIVYLKDIDVSDIRSISLPTDSFRLPVGGEIIVPLSIFPNYDKPIVQWNSSDPSIIKVQEGKMTALRPGKVVISARVEDLEVSMTIDAYLRAQDFELPEEICVFAQNPQIITVDKTIPDNAEIVLMWNSSDEMIATVDQNGSVYGKKPGNDVVISATTYDGITKNVLVHILPAIDEMDVLYLPEGTKMVEDEAFYNTASEVVIIPNGCTKIGTRAFAYCPNLKYIEIPNSIISVAKDAFEGSDQVFTYYVK